VKGTSLQGSNLIIYGHVLAWRCSLTTGICPSCYCGAMWDSMGALGNILNG